MVCKVFSCLFCSKYFFGWKILQGGGIPPTHFGFRRDTACLRSRLPLDQKAVNYSLYNDHFSLRYIRLTALHHRSWLFFKMALPPVLSNHALPSMLQAHSIALVSTFTDRYVPTQAINLARPGVSKTPQHEHLVGHFFRQIRVHQQAWFDIILMCPNLAVLFGTEGHIILNE